MTDALSESQLAILAVNDAFVRYFNAGDVEQLVDAMYDEDARLLPPNDPPIRGRERILEAYRQILASGMAGLAVENCEVVVSRSDDLAYATGTFSVTAPRPDRAKFLEVYRRRADGSWRCVEDMFSSDSPPA